MGPGPSETITDILTDLAHRQEERLTLGEVAGRMRGRAYGLILLVLALPEVIPMIGLSLILAIPIALVSGHMLVRGNEMALPGFLRNRSVKRAYLRNPLARASRVLGWLERISRPRWPRLATATRLQGAVCVVMSVILALPVPGLNILAAFGVFGTGLGVLQRDGVIVAIAFGSATLAAAGMAAVTLGIVTLAT